MPVFPHTVTVIVRDVFGNILNGATVTVIHSNGTLTGTTNSNGRANIQLGQLSSWVMADALEITATKTAEGTVTLETTISSGGGQTHNMTLEETSNFDFERMSDTPDSYGMNFVILSHYDGEKVTRLRPLPVQTENPLDKYIPTDDDFASDPNYTSWTDRLGNWYIVRDNIADGTHRYARGSSDYETNWTNREELEYDYFYNVF